MKNKLIYIMGVAGSGKSTIGRLLSEKTGIPFFDGDDFHPASNIQKMKEGKPLTDEDRMAWLSTLNELGKTELANQGVIIACSALKKMYRDILTKDIPDEYYWIWLSGTFELIEKRMRSRPGHFMPVHLLQSQFETLEPPAEALKVDIGLPPKEIIEFILTKISVAFN